MAKLQPVNKGNGIWGCPDCPYEHEEKGSVRLHHYWTHGDGLQKKRDKNKHPDRCEHDWDLLNPSKSAAEGRAIELGYKKICRRCDELG